MRIIDDLYYRKCVLLMNLMNRVLEGKIVPSSQVRIFIDQAREILEILAVISLHESQLPPETSGLF